jgi:TP901 family phage tail tape measure protein
MTRVGASQVFFNVVAGFNARKLIADQKTVMTVMKAVALDSFEAMLKPVEDLTMGIGVFINELKQVSVEMGKAEVEFKKFYGGVGTDALIDDLRQVGLEFAKVGTEALAAGSRAAQVAALVGNENIPFLVKQAEILSNISDLNSEEAMKGIIKLQQQTGVLYGNLNAQQFQRLNQLEKEELLTRRAAYALDALNTIANRSVAVEGELVEVMTNFSAQGALVGETFHDMAAMSAVLLEAGEEAGAAGRALRMIYARMGGDIGGARTKLEQMGIQIRDSNGDILTMREVMTNLLDKGWNRFTPALKQNIAQTIAGNRHYVRFIKLMENANRSFELAEDGMRGYDSATEQAKEAMESLAYQMQRAEAESENLKAALGENMLPFQIGAQKARNDFTEMQKSISDMFGKDFGEAIGRMSVFMDSMGGIIKFGLGMQTMAIGVKMFDAVQRDMHGILIANEYLHSKQATHLEFGVRATKDQEQALKLVRYQYQKINAAREAQQAHLLKASIIEQKLNHFGYTSEEIEERKNQLLKERAEIREKLMAVGKYTNLLEGRHTKSMRMFDNRTDAERQAQGLKVQQDYYERINQLLQNNLKLQGSGLELEVQYQQVFKSGMTKREAYNKMVIVANDVMQTLTTEEIQDLEKKRAELSKHHTMYQTLIEENERIRALQLTQGTRGTTTVSGSQNPLANAMAVELLPEITKRYNDLKASIKQTQKQIDDPATKDMHKKVLEEQLIELKKNEAGYKNLTSSLEGLKNGTQEYLTINEKGLAVLQKGNIETIGHQIHIDNTLQKVDIQKKATENLATIQDAYNLIQSDTNYELSELQSILQPVIDLEHDLADALKRAEHEQANMNDETQERIALEDIIRRKQKLGAKHLKMLEEENKKAAKALASEAKDSAQRLGYAFASLGSVLAGFAPKLSSANQALLSTMLALTTLGPAVGSVSKAFMDFKKTQMDIIKNSKSAKEAIMGVGSAIGPQIAIWAGITAAVYLFNVEQEKANALLKEQQELIQTQATALQNLQSGSELFDSKYLSNITGIAEGTTVADLANDTTLLQQAYEAVVKTNYEALDLSKAQKEQLAAAKEMVEILYMKETGATSTTSFDKAAKDAQALIGYGDTVTDGVESITDSSNNMAQTILGVLGLTDGVTDNQKALQELHKSGFYLTGDGVNFVKDSQRLLDESVRIMGSGVRLTKDQLKALSELLDTDIYDAIVNMNDLVVTSSQLADIDFTLEDINLDDPISSLGDMSEQVQNLTDDIYDFGNAKEELFFGGKYGNVTGSLYKQVVKQGVGTLYNKMDIVMQNNFNGFFNEREAADRIIAILNDIAPSINASNSA